MGKLLKRLLGSALAIYLVVCTVVWAGQGSSLYYPDPTRVSPAVAGVPEMVEVELHGADTAPLYSWWREPQAGRPVILFFHGNGGSVAGRAPRFAIWMDHGFGVLAVEYPGYGGSGGSPSENSITAASEAAWNWLSDAGLKDQEIVIYGESLGSAVAVKLAAQHDARALVLEAPMYSVLSIAQSYYPYLPVKLLLRDPWLSGEHITNVRSPLLVLHGDRDTLIPIESGRALFDAASEPKEFVTVRGAGHNNLRLFSPEVQVEAFLERHP